jgi:hypothetical protein
VFFEMGSRLNLAIERLKMIPAIQSITEPTTVGRSQLCLDIKISRTVALRTHLATTDLLLLLNGNLARTHARAVPLAFGILL